MESSAGAQASIGMSAHRTPQHRMFSFRLEGLVLENAHGASDPPVAVNPRQVATLRASGASWKVISQRLGIGVGTACRALHPPSKNPPESSLVSA